MGPESCPHPINGTRLCTFGPAGSVPASHTLRSEGERPTGYTEAMAAAVARRGRAHGVWRAISLANIDRKVTYFYLKIKGSIYLGNPMETCKKVAGLWTVTRNGPKPSGKWLAEMYIWTFRLPPRLSDAQRRGRTTQRTPRGDGGGGARPERRQPRSGVAPCNLFRSDGSQISTFRL